MATMEQVLWDAHRGLRLNGRHAFKAHNAGLLDREWKLTAAGKAMIAGRIAADAAAKAKAAEQATLAADAAAKAKAAEQATLAAEASTKARAGKAEKKQAKK